jgi:hypothetical protein
MYIQNAEKKAKQFTLDSRIFIRSLSDALSCTKQIAEIRCSRGLYYNYISILENSLQKDDILLAKYCDHELCHPNIIASKNIKSYEIYFMMKFSVNLFINYYSRLKKTKDYFDLTKEFDLIHTNLNEDLKDLVSSTKRKNLIITTDDKC